MKPWSASATIGERADRIAAYWADALPWLIAFYLHGRLPE